MRTRRDIVRRRRRERQLLVFGVLFIALAGVGALAVAVFQGRVDAPIQRAFVTPAEDFSSTVTLACAPADPVTGEPALPMLPEEIPLRVLNATDKRGLAGTTLEVLSGRGYVALQATNSNTSYAEAVRIQFGENGLRQAYSLAAAFPEVEFVIDNRESAVVDVILGERFEITQMRPQYAPELDPTIPLTAPGQCLPVDLVPKQPAPRNIPVDPLVPTASPSPSASATPSA